MTTQFEFVDDVQQGRRGPVTPPILYAFADALRANPGRWAKYPNQEGLAKRSIYSIASRIRTHGTVANGVLLVRYTGNPS